jgi:hypothetical protein
LCALPHKKTGLKAGFSVCGDALFGCALDQWSC